MLLLDPRQIKVIIDLFERGAGEIELSKENEKIKITKNDYKKMVGGNNKWHDTGLGKIIIGVIIGVVVGLILLVLI